MHLSFITDKDIDNFQTLIIDLKEDLGPRFEKSIENWCGIGERPYPLRHWHIYLVRNEDNKTIGICSYYQQQEDPVDRFWIGWIGVSKDFRRKNIGCQMVDFLKQEVKTLGAKEVRVYADSEDAQKFYNSLGFQVFGTFADTGLQQAAAKGQETVMIIKL